MISIRSSGGVEDNVLLSLHMARLFLFFCFVAPNQIIITGKSERMQCSATTLLDLHIKGTVCKSIYSRGTSAITVTCLAKIKGPNWTSENKVQCLMYILSHALLLSSLTDVYLHQDHFTSYTQQCMIK